MSRLKSTNVWLNGGNADCVMMILVDWDDHSLKYELNLHPSCCKHKFAATVRSQGSKTKIGVALSAASIILQV